MVSVLPIRNSTSATVRISSCLCAVSDHFSSWIEDRHDLLIRLLEKLGKVKVLVLDDAAGPTPKWWLPAAKTGEQRLETTATTTEGIAETPSAADGCGERTNENM